jgi:AraC family transcriptional regulator
MLSDSRRAATNGRQVILLATDFLGISCTEHSPQLSLAPHSHSVATITIVLGGGYWENLGSGDVVLPPMAVAIKPANTSHSNRVDERGARCLLLELSERSVDELRDARKLFTKPRTIDLTRFGALALRLLAVHKDALSCEEVSLRLLAALNDEIGRSSTCSAGHWLERIRDRLHSEDNAAQISVRRLADEAGYHPVYLARAFKKRFGQSIGAYARGLRVSRTARHIAASDSGSLSRIAQCCGYHDHSHLSNDFRDRTWMSPAEWRRLSRSVGKSA